MTTAIMFPLTRKDLDRELLTKPGRYMTDREYQAKEQIRLALGVIVPALATFEQTTHHHIGIGPDQISDVAECLVKAYKNPTAYNLSNLSQAVQSLR